MKELNYYTDVDTKKNRGVVISTGAGKNYKQQEVTAQGEIYPLINNKLYRFLPSPQLDALQNPNWLRSK